MSAARDIKNGMGFIFVYSGILPKRVLPRGNDRVDFGPALFFSLSLSLSISHPFPRFAASLFPLFLYSYFPRLAKRRTRMNKGQWYVQDIPPLAYQILTFP